MSSADKWKGGSDRLVRRTQLGLFAAACISSLQSLPAQANCACAPGCGGGGGAPAPVAAPAPITAPAGGGPAPIMPVSPGGTPTPNPSLGGINNGVMPGGYAPGDNVNLNGYQPTSGGGDWATSGGNLDAYFNPNNQYVDAGVSDMVAPQGPTTGKVPPKAVIIIGKDGSRKDGLSPHDPQAIETMSKDLNANVIKGPTKEEFLEAIKGSDIIYINAHTYGADYNLFDKGSGRTGIQLNDTATFGRNESDVVTPGEIKNTMKSRDVQADLVVINGCRGEKFGMEDAFGAKTVIDYKPSDRNIGPAGDSFWKNTIHGWTAGGKPLDQAVNDAKTAAPGGTFGEVGVAKTHTVHGDTTQTYKDSYKAPPAKVEPTSE